MVIVNIPLAPHGDANMHDSFMTTYDKEYSMYSGTSTLSHGNRSQDNGSGHTSNRPLFARPQGFESSTTNKDMFPTRSGAMSAEQWNDLRNAVLLPKDHSTAFVRLGSTHKLPGVVHGAPATVSTMKSSYLNFGRVGTSPTVGAPMYSGAATASYIPNFLSINSPDDAQARKGAVETHEAIHPHPGRSRLMHVSNSPGTYFQHSRLIGDKSLAYPSQLPTPLSAASDFESTRGRSMGPRSMLDTLSGRSVSSAPSVNSIESLCNTNPLAMSPPEQETCRVARRVENQGNVKGSTYQAHFINQRNLPELPDPAKDTQSRNTVALPNVKAQPHETVVLTDSRGQLFSDKPDGVHPSVWKRLQSVEKALSVDKIDPHAHKRRSVSVR